MTPSERFTLILFGLGILMGLIGWALRMLWGLSAGIQSSRDATAANSGALSRLTDAVNTLNERVARLEGPRRNR